VTLRILLVDAPHLGGSATSTRLPGQRQGSEASQDTFFKMTLQFERKYSTQGSGAPCHVSFGFFSPDFSGFSCQDFRWTLSQSLLLNLRLGGYSIWSAILQSHLDISSGFKTRRAFFGEPSKAVLEDAWDYSRRLQDCSNISWSTFQPRDASTTLGDF
jgi:hypothetical protein